MSRGDWLTASAVNACFLNCWFCEIRITAAILLMYWKTMAPFSVNFPMDSEWTVKDVFLHQRWMNLNDSLQANDIHVPTSTHTWNKTQEPQRYNATYILNTKSPTLWYEAGPKALNQEKLSTPNWCLNIQNGENAGTALDHQLRVNLLNLSWLRQTVALLARVRANWLLFVKLPLYKRIIKYSTAGYLNATW